LREDEDQGSKDIDDIVVKTAPISLQNVIDSLYSCYFDRLFLVLAHFDEHFD